MDDDSSIMQLLEIEEAEDRKGEPDAVHHFTLWLTLIHTFIYMVNYYVYAPTANLYTEALGF